MTYLHLFYTHIFYTDILYLSHQSNIINKYEAFLCKLKNKILVVGATIGHVRSDLNKKYDFQINS